MISTCYRSSGLRVRQAARAALLRSDAAKGLRSDAGARRLSRWGRCPAGDRQADDVARDDGCDSIGQIDIGGQSFSDVAKGIELFATKVAPALRKASA